MNTTSKLSSLPEFATESKVLANQIKDWINSNMHSSNQSFVWNIGISTGSRIVQVTGTVRNDFECKHFRYWNVGTFKNAMSIVSDLNKLPLVFKSPLNKYAGKGRYIFIYKTSCASKNLFYHTLHH